VKAMAKKYYAIRVGKRTGVFYDEWANVKTNIDGFKNAEYKGFATKSEAEHYFNSYQTQSSSDEMFDVLIYCDGSYTPSRRNRFSAGAVVVKDGAVIQTISKYYENAEFAATRNVAGEILAIIEALDYCQQNQLTNILFLVDYQGLISWWNGSWKTNSAISKYYLAELKRYTTLQFEFRKVDAHTGVEFNEMADQLAKAGTVKGQIPNWVK
jgi:viroplasmin and RNaseH domain-containing protein